MILPDVASFVLWNHGAFFMACFHGAFLCQVLRPEEIARLSGWISLKTLASSHEDPPDWERLALGIPSALSQTHQTQQKISEVGESSYLSIAKKQSLTAYRSISYSALLAISQTRFKQYQAMGYNLDCFEMAMDQKPLLCSHPNLHPPKTRRIPRIPSFDPVLIHPRWFYCFFGGDVHQGCENLMHNMLCHMRSSANRLCMAMYPKDPTVFSITLVLSIGCHPEAKKLHIDAAPLVRWVPRPPNLRGWPTAIDEVPPATCGEIIYNWPVQPRYRTLVN